MKTVGLFFGGMSNEHDVSLASAKNIIQQIDTKKYELLLFYISSKGDLYQLSTLMQVDNIQELPTISFKEIQQRIDIAFPITHGKYGEDGNLQGFFEWYHIPYCGCRILSSALCMDKGMFKQMMQSANIPQVPFSTLDFSLISNSELSKSNLIALSDFSLPLYVKPANSGSSIGITKVEDFKHLSQAIEKARTYDTKIIVEQGLIALKEIEVAVIGNEHLTISEP
jgi:D-alanine-D-alanine ligase